MLLQTTNERLAGLFYKGLVRARNFRSACTRRKTHKLGNPVGDSYWCSKCGKVLEPKERSALLPR